MGASAAPPPRLYDGSTNSDLDERFQSLWHFHSVLSPQSSSKAQDSLAVSELLTASPHIDLSGEDMDPTSQDNAPPGSSAHHLQPLFQMFDENNDGEVSLDEMMCVLRKLGTELSRSCLVSLMEPLDRNGDMAVNFDEFTVLYRSIYRRELELDMDMQEGSQQIDSEELLDIFNVYDKNRDGYICAAELATVLGDLGFSEGTDLRKCQTLIDRVDTDGNGLVDFLEFKEMLCRGCGISQS